MVKLVVRDPQRQDPCNFIPSQSSISAAQLRTAAGGWVTSAAPVASG